MKKEGNPQPLQAPHPPPNKKREDDYAYIPIQLLSSNKYTSSRNYNCKMYDTPTDNVGTSTDIVNTTVDNSTWNWYYNILNTLDPAVATPVYRTGEIA